MRRFDSAQDLLALAAERKGSIADIIIDFECQETQEPREAVIGCMRSRLRTMEESITKGRAIRSKTHSGLSGGNAARLLDATGERAPILGDLARQVMTDAVAVAERNASFGKIVAAPTAGAAGILPAVVLNVGKAVGADEKGMVRSLFTAAGIGILIARHATLAGAEGGCQAECGAGAAMAAAAAADLRGGDPETILHAAALALKNSLGLTCDPVAGLVEVPCVKRNGFYAVHAVVAVDMAIAGVRSEVPFDEVVSAMHETGRLMSDALRESSLGGLAATETAKEVEKRLAAE
ncbi:MAG: L-serine ammonia-lyase, iron-sulfur-dependent, subunit alpha [Planctomycetes bacterium]|nr:L-serine ammonia-lyase, iron-sulfur-dependent, subunit alpha [Planctomycetota bacterium]